MTVRYSISCALQGFTQSTQDIRTTLKCVAPPRSVNPDLKNYVLGAGTLFLSAAIENFISDLFKGICQRAATHALSPTDLPPALLGWAFLYDGHLDRAKNFVARTDEGDFIQTTGKYIQDELLACSGPFLTTDRANGIDDKAYPSVKNLKRMFKRIGLNDVFSQLSARMKQDAVGKLRSFNNVRGSLAHIGISGGFSYRDIRDQLDWGIRFVGALDKVTFYHLRKIGAVSIWS